MQLQIPRRQKSDKPVCPACERRVHDEAHAVRLHSDLYHARCALYQRRP